MVDIPEPSVQVEQVDGNWYVVRRQSGDMLRTFSVREAQKEADGAEKRGDAKLAEQLRNAATELERKKESL